MTHKRTPAIREALADTNLQSALGRFCDGFPDARANVYQGRDFPKLQQEIAAVKRESAARMEELAAEFTRQAVARGAVVYRAATAEDARAYILKLARERGVSLIVKSKSMASEEIHLNDYLEGHGLEVVETDLGERILQLSDTHPSHMVMPAIHLTREQVAEIFARETGEPVPAEIPALVKIARARLREKFLAAQMGISGANAAVAETGTLVILTNEGNGRLTTTLPPVHVALVGLEKLVARLDQVGPILEALPRSATAQPLTSYVTMITGATPAIGLDGQERTKELHIILLDNGRTALRDDPVFAEALQCIRCASCLNVCPVFQKIGGHVFGHVYTGAIGTVLTAFFHGLAAAQEVADLCINCHRCRDYCPGGIDLPRLIVALRERLVAQRGLPFSQRLFFERVLTNRGLFHALLRAAHQAQRPYVKDGLIRHLPLWFAGITGARALPPIAARPLRARAAGWPEDDRDRPRVALFAGCLVDFVYPEVGEDMAAVLRAAGFSVRFPSGQTCCGFPARYTGLPEAAQTVARQNIQALEGVEPDFVLTPCPTCTAALQRDYPALFAQDPVWGPRAAALAQKVREFSSFILEHGAALPPAAPEAVTYHDSCHLRRVLGVSEEPRQVLARAGKEVRETPGRPRCCGFGGQYTVKFPDLSRALLQTKIGALDQVEANTVVTDCPGCLLQLRGGLAGDTRARKVRHTAEILAEGLKKN